MKYKILTILTSIILTISILSNIVLAIDWNTDLGSYAQLGVSFQQPNGYYYRVNSNRAIYRTYLSNNDGSGQDYSKNIFCLDMNGLFPTETTSGSTSGSTSQFKSVGELKSNSTVTLSSRSNSTRLSAAQVGKIMAIMNVGYNYDLFQDRDNILVWLQTAASGWTEEDQEAIADLLDADDIFVLQQVAIWEITNGLDTATLQETRTPSVSQSWNSAESHKLDAQAIILSYFRDVADNYTNYMPNENAAIPEFVSKSTQKTAQKVGGYIYVGPFQINNSNSLKEYTVYSITTQNGQETQSVLSNYGVYNGNTSSATSYGSIKNAGNNSFYIRIPVTTANSIDKIKIEISSTTRKMTLWNKENDNTAQPLVSFSEEENIDTDEAAVEKYDVALRKFITKVNGVDIADSRVPVVTAQNDTNAFNGTDFKYTHEKEPVEVKVGDKVTYTIRVYNECDKKVVVKGIKDYLPQGLEIADEETNWQEVTDGDGNRYAVLIANTDISLDAANISGTTKNVTAADRTITCVVTDEISDGDILTNVAEITGLTDENGINVIDEDSEEDNLSDDTRTCPDDYAGESGESDLSKEDFYYYGEEDEDDFEKLIVSYKKSIPVEKVWNDNNNQDGSRPSDITVKLYANGEDTGKTLTLNNSNGWKGSFTELPVKQDGKDIVYTVTETSTSNLEKYSTDIQGDENTGFVITNTYTPSKINISGTKSWEDNNNQDGLRPQTITVNLYANGEKVDSKQVTGPNWTYSFTNLDEYENGVKINYTIDEEVVEYYEKEINNYDITNKYTPEKINIPVEKIWDDNDNQDGKRPESVLIKLLADGEDTGKTVELNEGNGWKSEFTDLDVNKDGKEIVYTVEEIPVPDGYTVSITGDKTNGFVVTNSYTPGKINIPVEKVWNDNNNQDGKRLESVTIKLLADGEDTGKAVELNEENSWKSEFTDLDVNKDGKEIVYTIEENPVPSGYTVSITGDKTNGFVVTNSYTPGKINIPVEKVWSDNNNQDGKRPESVTIRLLADGEDTGKTVELNEENGWKSEFTDLDVNKDGKEIVYTIEEDPVPDGYTVSITGDKTSGFVVTNSYTPGKINIPVEKVWDDSNNQEGKRPESVTIRLLADGEDTGKTVELNEENGWKSEFTDLDVNKDGKEIVYTIAEDPVPDGYEVSITGDKTNGFIITNTHKSFDLALKKFITTVRTPKADGTFEEVEYAEQRMISADGSSLETTTDATYEMDKTTVKVKPGDRVVYTIRIYNEGETDGYPSVIADTLPEGLEFISDSEINQRYGWTLIVDSTSSGWNTGVRTDYLDGTVIPAYNKETGELSYEEVQIELRVVATEPEEIINIAEILDDSGEDRDSTPNNLDEEEDDQDYDVIIPFHKSLIYHCKNS